MTPASSSRRPPVGPNSALSENQARGRFASPDRRVCQLPQPEVCWLRSHSTPMRSLSFSICLASAGLAACTYLRTAGPTAGEVIDQGLCYDVVDIIRAPVARRGDRDRRYPSARHSGHPSGNGRSAGEPAPSQARSQSPPATNAGIDLGFNTRRLLHRQFQPHPGRHRKANLMDTMGMCTRRQSLPRLPKMARNRQIGASRTVPSSGEADRAAELMHEHVSTASWSKVQGLSAESPKGSSSIGRAGASEHGTV